MKRKQLNAGIVYILIAAVLYAIMPILVRLLGHQIPPFSQVFLRYVVAGGAALAYARVRCENLSFPKKWQQRLILVGMGIFGYGLMNVFYTFGVLNTSITNALFLLFTFSVITPLLAVVFLGERLTRALMLSLILVVVGLLFMFQPQFGASDVMGMGFALIGAVLYALYMIGRRTLPQSSSYILAYSTVLGMISVGVISLVAESGFYTGMGELSIGAVTPFTWAIVILFGLDNFAAWYFVAKGLESIPAGIGSIVLLVELILGPIFAFFIFGEMPVVATIIGAGFIFAGAANASRVK